MVTAQELVVTCLPLFSVLLVLLIVGFYSGKTGSAVCKPRATRKPALLSHTSASKRASKGRGKKLPGNFITSENPERPCGNKARRKALNRKREKHIQQSKKTGTPGSISDPVPDTRASAHTTLQSLVHWKSLLRLPFHRASQSRSLTTSSLAPTNPVQSPQSPSTSATPSSSFSSPSSPSSASTSSSAHSSAAAVSSGDADLTSTPAIGSAAQSAGNLSWWHKLRRFCSWRSAAKSATSGTPLRPKFNTVAASHSGTELGPAIQDKTVNVEHQGNLQSSSADPLAASGSVISAIVSNISPEQQQVQVERQQEQLSTLQLAPKQSLQQQSSADSAQLDVAQTKAAQQQQSHVMGADSPGTQQQQSSALHDSNHQPTAQPEQAERQGLRDSLHHQQRPACDGTTASQLCTAVQMQAMQKQLADRDAQVAELTDQLQQQWLDKVLAKGESAGLLAKLCTQLAQQAATHQRANVVIADQKAALAQRDADVANQRAAIAQRDTDIVVQQTSLDLSNARLSSHTATLVKQNKDLADCHSRMADMEQKLCRLEEAEALRCHPDHIANELPDRSAFGGVRHKDPRRVFNPLQGTGGAGFVEAAQTHLLGSHVYKWPHDKLDDDLEEEQDSVKEEENDLEEEEDDLEEEAKFLSLFRHPFVVAYYGRCMDTLGTLGLQGKRGLVLERMDTTADKLLKQKKALPLKAIVKMGTNIASALAFVHKMGFLHADVKPDNVGISHVGSPGFIAKLLDFGLVKRIGQEWHDTEGIGMPTNVHFAPPEFCSVKRRGGTVYPMNSSADVWSFGLVLAQVAGLHKVSNPGSDTDSWVNFIAKLEGEYPVEWQHGRKYLGLHYPKEFQNIVNQCLSANPEDRPTMRHVVERLQEVPLTGDPEFVGNDAQPVSPDSESASSGSGPDECGSEWQYDESGSESECKESDSECDSEEFDNSDIK